MPKKIKNQNFLHGPRLTYPSPHFAKRSSVYASALTNRRPERNFNLLNLEVYFRKVVGRRRMMVARSLMLGLACSRPGGEKLSTLRSGNPGSGIPKLQPARLGNTQKLRSFFPLSPARARRSPRRGSGCSKVVHFSDRALVALIPAGSRESVLPSGAPNPGRSPASPANHIVSSKRRRFSRAIHFTATWSVD